MKWLNRIYQMLDKTNNESKKRGQSRREQTEQKREVNNDEKRQG